MERRRSGIILVIFGAGVFLIGLSFSVGGSGALSFVQNIKFRESVFVEGELVPEKTEAVGEGMWRYNRVVEPSHYEGRIAVPFKYIVSLSVVLVLSGVGIILIEKK